MMDEWRSMRGKDKDEFKEWLDVSINQRLAIGEAKYHSSEHGFHGEPLDHAIEEALDLIFYLYMEKRRQRDEG